MKTKILTIILFYCTSIKAQDKNIKIETIINDQFGTLLEGLVTDGKIDQNGAKSYLETVFGYEDGVSNYLQTSDFTQKFNALKQSGNNSSTDILLQQLSSNLISFIPAEKQQAFIQNINAQMMVQGSMNEMLSGNIGTNTISLAAGLVTGIKEAKSERLKKEAITEKLKNITPTLSKINTNIKPYKKLRIVDNTDSQNNWVVNSNPPILYETGEGKYTTNASIIENGVLKINTENYVMAVYNWDKETRFERARFYKNPEKFDFSKDFLMNLYVQVSEKTRDFTIEIGRGYQLTILPKANGTNTWISSPVFYRITDKYGFLTEDRQQTKEKTKDTVSYDKTRKLMAGKNKKWGNYIVYGNKKNPDLNFSENVVKLTILKKGNNFSFKINDAQETEISNEISYFPDKYYLGFEVNSSSIGGKNGWLKISKLELEHL